MSIPRPSLLLNFAEAPGIVDPRISFTRATTRTYRDRFGVLKTAPAGAPAWSWHPITGQSLGMMIEGQRTNLALRSEELDNASWTKTNASISANSAAAPDGATTADTITVSGASGSANQAVTITAGNAITVSVHFRLLTSSHGRIRISDGTNQVAAWFNLSSGTVGTASAGASTCVYSAHSIEALPGSWYRCQLTVTTATSTSFTVYVSCAAADNTEPANADSVYAWGVQVESPGTSSAASAYIPTTSASATRNGDAVLVPVGTSWFNTAEGTLLLEWVGRPGVTSRVYGGIGNTFNDVIYLSSTATQLVMTVGTGGVNQAQMFVTHANADGTTYRAAMAWATNDFALCIDGAAPSTDTGGTVPTGIARIGIGNAPWQSTGGTQPGMPFRRAIYWPKRLSNAVLQTITQ